MNKKFIQYFIIFISLFFSFTIISCDEEGNTLAPYVGSPVLADISIEENSFLPRINWTGGYVSVLGVNRGTRAALDTSLVWLIKTDGNNLKYPIRFNEVPSGAESLTTQFGGTPIDSLSEDQTYTFWLLKEDVWNQVSANRNSNFVVDSLLNASQIVIGDSVRINPYSYSNLTKPLDVFINISNLNTFGNYGNISVTEIFSNRPLITWEITGAGITDSAISVIGIAEGGQYDASATIWEVYAFKDSIITTQTDTGLVTDTIQVKTNIINAPLFAGQEIPGATTFVEFTLPGLERNKTYYIWIAGETWNGEGRLRITPGYAYATFNVD